MKQSLESTKKYDSGFAEAVSAFLPPGVHAFRFIAARFQPNRSVMNDVVMTVVPVVMMMVVMMHLRRSRRDTAKTDDECKCGDDFLHDIPHAKDAMKDYTIKVNVSCARSGRILVRIGDDA